MNKRAAVITVVIGFICANRVPAPIVEEEKPTPRAATVQSAKPKTKRVTEPKTEHAGSPSPAPAAFKKFAGKWSGIMPEVPWGNVQTELIVDSTETRMEWQESGNHKGSAKAEVNGNTLSARIPIGFTTAVWFITPAPDGITADIRMTAFMNDDHAVFRRVSQ